MNEKMNGGISTMRGIFCRLSFQKGGITAETIAAQGFDGGIFSVDTRQKPVYSIGINRFFVSVLYSNCTLPGRAESLLDREYPGVIKSFYRAREVRRCR